MIIWIGLIIGIAIIGFQIAIYKRRSKQLNNLESYAILLLLHDEFREAQKQTLSEYIKTLNRATPSPYYLRRLQL